MNNFANINNTNHNLFMENQLDFQNICKKEITDIKSKTKVTKSKGLAFFKRFEKSSIEETEFLLDSNKLLCQKLFKQKSALHWAAKNKNFLILEIVIQFFIKNNWNLDIKCLIDNKNNINENIASYCLSMKKYSHYLLCLSYGISIEQDPVHFSKNSFLYYHLEQLKNYKPLIYNFIKNDCPSWTNNPLSLSFWGQHKEMLKIIFNNQFYEKKEWINQLKKEIHYFSLHEEMHLKLYDGIVFYLCDYLGFVETLEILHSSTKEQSLDGSKYLSDNLNKYLGNRFMSLSNTEFHKYILSSFSSSSTDVEVLMQDLFFDNSLFIKNEYLSAVNSLYLSYKLQKELNNKNHHKPVSKI